MAIIANRRLRWTGYSIIWLVLWLTISPLAARLLLWYPLDEGLGAQVLDSSGNGNVLASEDGGFTWNQKANAPFGGSIYFNGGGSAVASKTEREIQPATINFLRSVTSNKFTVSFWANPDAESQGSPPFGFSRSDLTRVVQMHLLQNGFCWFDVGYPNSGSNYYRAGGSMSSPVGTWTHWTFVFDGALSSGALKIFRNGSQVAESTAGAGAICDWSQIALFGLGASQRYDTKWKGALDDFALWDEALTTEQISTVKANGVQSLAAPLIDSFKAVPGNVGFGDPTTLTWSTRLASSLSIAPAVGAVTGPSGTITVNPVATTTYRLTAVNGFFSTTRDVVVGVNEPEQPLVISEFLADNGSGLLDEDGAKSDWVEIHNPNLFAVSLNGWTLSDSGATWIFPSVQIEGGQYLVIFASDKNRRIPGSPLHTNFKLGADGDSMTLKRPNGAISSALIFPPQRTDISGGINSEGNAIYFPTPSPGASNSASILGFVADPVFTVGRGFFSAPQSISLSCATAGAIIRYTTDGSTPTETNGTIYGGPISVTATTILRARAFKPSSLASFTVTQSYFFLNDVLNQVYGSGTAPAGWPVNGWGTLNGQQMRYGLNPTLREQYTSQQIIDGLRQLPTVSIVTDQANLTGQSAGIYSNAMQEGIDWERPASAEYIKPDGSSRFQINCGLRIRGGYSRHNNYPKHGFRLFFRSSYGKNSLAFPLYGTSGAAEFESIDLRTEQNYHYANTTDNQNTAVHEVFCRDLQTAVGKPTTRSSSVQLYVNGQYWGLFMTEERAQQDYGASYFGGSDDDYDVVQSAGFSGSYLYELSNGTVNAWQQTWNLSRACATNPTNENYFKIQGKNAVGARDSTLPVYIDADSLAGTMLLYYYTGDGDAILSTYLSDKANNWRGIRNRVTPEKPWTFFLHDSEHTMQRSAAVTDRVNFFVSRLGSGNRSNFTCSNPEFIFEDLALNAEFRLKIADVAQRYFFNNGPLTPTATLPIFNARASEIDKAIIPDMVRWGQSSTNHTYSQWLGQLTGIRDNFFPNRAASVISQLKLRGFYPNVSPPSFSQRGGRVTAGFPLTLDKNGQPGTIYYTTDGSDPRAAGGAAIGQAVDASGVVTLNSPATVRTRFLGSSGEWSALDEAVFAFAPAASATNLIVSKLDYHPPDLGGFGGTDLEYLELMNITADDVNLRNVQITSGVTFSFATSSISTLAPGGRVLVVSNPAGFASRHGSGLPIAGTYSGNLSNSGELIKVVGAGGAVIKQFTYSDSSPWPVEADGDGPALTLKKPTTNPDPNIGTNWRASTQPGGLPGAEDPTPTQVWRIANFSAADLADPAREASVWGDLADPDNDGLANIFELGMNGNPNVVSTMQQPVMALIAGNLTISYARSKSALADLVFTGEKTGALTVPWTSEGITTEILSDNGVTQQVRISVPMDGAAKFLRLRVTRP